jgi:predicted ATPase
MAQHKLREISIAGYKSIRDARVELGDINILIGANGAGKSNLLSAFGLLRDIVEGRLGVHVVQRGGANALLHFGRKVTDQMKITLELERKGYVVSLAPTANDTFYFAEEVCFVRQPDDPIKLRTDSLGAGHTETKLDVGELDSHIRDSIRSWRAFHFHDTSESAPVKQRHKLDDDRYLRSDAKNLAAFLYRLRETGKRNGTTSADETSDQARASYKQIVASVRRVAPFFDDFVLEPDRIQGETIRLAWRERGSDEDFDAHTLSDGTLRFICLATLLLQPHSLLPTTILIDEPELGLHPAAIHLLAGMIRSVCQHAQVIISTQSVTLLNQFTPDQVIVVERDKRGSIFRQIPADEIATWLDDYSLGELWEKNVLGGRPR